MTELVSVVVPTRNNARTLDACLASVKSQRGEVPIELIVVDNLSSDGTAAIASAHADQVLIRGPERSAQRNAGIRASSGEWVLWLDSDMVLTPDAIDVAVQTAHRTGANAVALPERTIGPGFWTACRALERSTYLDVPELHNPRLLRRELFEEVGEFGVSMSGPEDTDLRMRLRARNEPIELAPVIIDHDEGRLTLRDVWQKRYYYGLSIPELARRHAGAVGEQRSLVLKAYRRHWRDLLAHPVQAAGMIVMRAMEAVGYSYGAWRGARK